MKNRVALPGCIVLGLFALACGSNISEYDPDSDNGAIIYHEACARCHDDDDEDIPAGRTLLRDYFGMHRFDWPDDEGLEFHLGHGDWIRVLRNNGFEILDLIEERLATE